MELDHGRRSTRWRFRELSDGRTRVTFRFAYGVAGGGIAGLVAERVASISLRRRFQQSLHNIKRAVEEQATVARR